MPTPTGPESPQLAAVQRTIGAGDERVLAAFWQAMASQGTPLIEVSTDNDAEVLVTFLRRGAKWAGVHHATMHRRAPAC
jgi:hypothetical protein